VRIRLCTRRGKFTNGGIIEATFDRFIKTIKIKSRLAKCSKGDCKKEFRDLKSNLIIPNEYLKKKLVSFSYIILCLSHLALFYVKDCQVRLVAPYFYFLFLVTLALYTLADLFLHIYTYTHGLFFTGLRSNTSSQESNPLENVYRGGMQINRFLTVDASTCRFTQFSLLKSNVTVVTLGH